MEENKHINSALNELSPLLEGISKTMPQTVPLGYPTVECYTVDAGRFGV